MAYLYDMEKKKPEEGEELEVAPLSEEELEEAQEQAEATEKAVRAKAMKGPPQNKAVFMPKEEK